MDVEGEPIFKTPVVPDKKRKQQNSEENEQQGELKKTKLTHSNRGALTASTGRIAKPGTTKSPGGKGKAHELREKAEREQPSIPHDEDLMEFYILQTARLERANIRALCVQKNQEFGHIEYEQFITSDGTHDIRTVWMKGEGHLQLVEKKEELKRRQLNTELARERYKFDSEKLTEAENYFENLRLAHYLESLRIRNEDNSPYKDFPVLFERYLITKLLGKGGFSEVWKAYDLENQLVVAIKIHKINPQWPEEYRNAFIKKLGREIQIQRKLNHDRVVKLYNTKVDTNNGDTFCILEYCSGGDLDGLIKMNQGGLPEKLAREIARQMVEGIAFLHAEKIIHYDIKPANVLFDKNGDVKLADFGLSKILDECGKEIDLTSQGAGTYWYLPPECFQKGKNQRISSKVDIWSLGVVLYQMLFNRKPFFNDYTQEEILSTNSIDDSLVVSFPPKPKLKPETKDFISLCLHPSLHVRPEIDVLAQHPFLTLQAKGLSRDGSNELGKAQNESHAAQWIKLFLGAPETQQWLREPQDSKDVVVRANEWAKRELKEQHVKPVKVIGSVTSWDHNMEMHYPDGKYIKRKNRLKTASGFKEITTCQWIPKSVTAANNNNSPSPAPPSTQLPQQPSPSPAPTNAIPEIITTPPIAWTNNNNNNNNSANLNNNNTHQNLAATLTPSTTSPALLTSYFVSSPLRSSNENLHRPSSPLKSSMELRSSNEMTSDDDIGESHIALNASAGLPVTRALFPVDAASAQHPNLHQNKKITAFFSDAATSNNHTEPTSKPTGDAMNVELNLPTPPTRNANNNSSLFASSSNIALRQFNQSNPLNASSPTNSPDAKKNHSPSKRKARTHVHDGEASNQQESAPGEVNSAEPHMRGHYRHVVKKKHRKFLQESGTGSNLGNTASNSANAAMGSSSVVLNDSGSLIEEPKVTTNNSDNSSMVAVSGLSVESGAHTVITIDDSLSS